VWTLGKKKWTLKKSDQLPLIPFSASAYSLPLAGTMGKEEGGVGKKGIGLPNIHVADVRGARSHALIFVRKGSPTGFIVAHRKPRPG